MAVNDVSAQVASSVATEIPRQVFGSPDASGTRNLVVSGWTSAQTYAASAFTAAQTYLTALQAAANAALAVSPIDPNTGAVLTAAAALRTFTNTPPAAAALSMWTATGPEAANYSSTLLSSLQTYISQWVSGAATGLPAAVEQALWDRGRAREVVASAKKAKEAIKQFAYRGFSKPPGALAVQLLEAVQEAQNNDVALSRDVMIKQSDLEQSNRRFAFETAWKIEDGLMRYQQDRVRRLLDAHVAWQQGLVTDAGHAAQNFGTQGSVFGAGVQADATVFRGRVDVNIAEANIRIESAKANLQALVQKATVLVEAIRAAGQISGQLAAAALSAVNLSGGVHDSTSWGLSVSEARSRSISESISSASNRQDNYTP